MSVFIAQIKKGAINLGTEYNEKRFREWLGKNEGKSLRIMTDDNKSDEARGYYFGALIPAIATHHNSDNYELWHEILKTEFNGVTIKKVKGGYYKVGMSTRKLNKHRFSEYLNRITGWMADQGITIPDHELYKQWRDEQGFIGEELST